MTQPLRFAERQPSEPVHLTAAQRIALETHFNASLASSHASDSFVVTTGDIVGTIRVDGSTLTVKPKVAIDRLLFMVAFAGDPIRWQDDWAELARTSDLVDGMAALFVRTCDRVLARGLYRAYRTVDADSAAVRGRIRWGQQARRLAPLPIAVRYHVHDDDVPENQVVRAALAVLRRLPTNSHCAQAGIARHWRAFKELSVLPRPVHALTRVAWTRQNQHYRPLLDLAGIILRGAMVELDSGTVPVPGFTLYMPEIFERFVRTALRHDAGLSIAEFPDKQSQHGLRLDVAGKVHLKPDLGVKINGEWRFIGDVKYKRDDGPGRDHDLYQLVTYATAAGLDEATLVYAQGPLEARMHTVRNAGIKLNLVHLDLSQPPDAVLRQLRAVRIAAATAVGRFGIRSGSR